MTALTRSLLAALAALLATVMMATAAQAYPDSAVEIHVSAQNVRSGKQISFDVSSPIPCKKWTAVFNGEQRSGSGLRFAGSFAAPVVQHTRVFVMVFSCETGSGNGRVVGHAGNAVMVTQQVITRSVRITVHPAKQAAHQGHHADHAAGGGTAGSGGAGGAAGLPDTGGPSAQLLGGALALVLAGLGTTLYSRRRARA